jgi:hypothetical protein
VRLRREGTKVRVTAGERWGRCRQGVKCV